MLTAQQAAEGIREFIKAAFKEYPPAATPDEKGKVIARRALEGSRLEAATVLMLPREAQAVLYHFLLHAYLRAAADAHNGITYDDLEPSEIGRDSLGSGLLSRTSPRSQD